MAKSSTLKYFLKVGRELVKEYHLKGFYLIIDREGWNCIGVSVDRPTNSHEIHSPGFYTTDTQTYYEYIDL